MTPPDHADARQVLDRFGVSADAFVGRGGEAAVYALDDDRVLRVSHDGGDVASLTARAGLVDELRRGTQTFDLPEVLDLGSVGHCHFAIERRLPGRSVLDALGDPDRPPASRNRLIESMLDAVASLAKLHLEDRPWWGDLLGEDPIRTETWHDFLIARIQRSLDAAPEAFAAVDADELATFFPEAEAPSFLHLDGFAGNMLCVGDQVTAVIDIGLTSAVGDIRLDVAATAVYTGARPITPTATNADHGTVLAWLELAGLADWYEPTRRWLAAYWAWAVDDIDLQAWCRTVLLDDR